MVTGVIVFIISWLVFYFLSKKERCPFYTLTCYVGIILALITDLLVLVYPLWSYPGTAWGKFGINIMNAFGLYFVVVYFFLQYLPKRQTLLSVLRYIFCWTLFTILLELFFLSIAFIEHDLWWNIGCSYVADWILFTTFFFHHKWILKIVTRRQDQYQFEEE